jgi:hypothetical protein
MSRVISRAAVAVAAGAVFASCSTTEERPSGGAAPAASAPAASAPQSAGGEAQRSGATASASTAGDAASAYELTGRVESVDRAKNTVRIGGRSLKVDSSTSVMKDGIGATLDEVREGDQVRASLSHGGEGPKAERIEVTSPGATGSQQR